MDIRALSIEGAWEFTPVQHPDDRGVFWETFRAVDLAPIRRRPFMVKQVNTSISAAGVLRGIHFAQLEPSQAKYVTCLKGAVLDVAIDIRVGSPTFGQWDTVLLDDNDRRSIFLSEGLGHAFVSLEDGSTVNYLCSEPYAPGREHGINPFDPAMAIEWPVVARDGSPLTLLTSPKDTEAPTLAEAGELGLLPTIAEAIAFLS